jgi:hypothetical protein
MRCLAWRNGGGVVEVVFGSERSDENWLMFFGDGISSALVFLNVTENRTPSGSFTGRTENRSSNLIPSLLVAVAVLERFKISSSSELFFFNWFFCFCWACQIGICYEIT